MINAVIRQTVREEFTLSVDSSEVESSDWQFLSSNKFFLAFVIMTPPHLYSVFLDNFAFLF